VTLPNPYRDAAPLYRAAGWLGVLPLPPGRKGPPPGGKRPGEVSWTGHDGRWPSGADIEAWREENGAGNIALRLPPDIIGIDVDAYAGKRGLETFTAAVAKWGPLPPTWISTARDDGVSGIRLFRVPEGLRWPGQLGEHVEIIQVGHRYMVVAPSTNPDAGGAAYHFLRPDGTPTNEPPTTLEPADLPERWVLGLTSGELAEDTTSANLATAEIQAWIVAHHRGTVCRAMTATLAKLLAEMSTGSAHEALRRTFGLCRLAEQGHSGLAAALTQARTAFTAEATRPGRHGATRSLDDAEAEWRRSLAGAVRRVVGTPTVDLDEHPIDPCVDPFAALVDSSYVAPAPPVLALPPAAPAVGPATPLPAAHPAVTASTAAGEAPVPPEGAFAADGDTWRRRDLRAARGGKRPTPAILHRADKRALFYPGKVNAIIGESESGKSWLALLAVKQEIEAGNRVVYLDFEDTDVTLVGRLEALGCDPDVVDEFVAYISPEETLTPAAAEILSAEVAAGSPTLVVLDGVNAAMARLGLDSNSTTDATRFAQILLARLVSAGAGVITIDHVSKNKETRGKGGIGSQAKRAMISGCAITAEIVTPFGRGMTGKIRLIVDKDRPGGVREHSAFGKNAGTAVIRSQVDPDRVTLEIEPADARPAEERETFQPTTLMQRVSAHLARNPGGCTQSQLERDVDGRATGIRAAIAALVDGKYIEARPSGKRGGGSSYHHLNHYRPDVDDLVGDEDDD
jgi:hypothetical protein